MCVYIFMCIYMCMRICVCMYVIHSYVYYFFHFNLSDFFSFLFCSSIRLRDS